MKVTKEQQIKWLEEKRCHVCGKNEPHSHPNWMWLANPVPESDNPELRDRIEIEKKLNSATLEKIIR